MSPSVSSLMCSWPLPAAGSRVGMRCRMVIFSGPIRTFRDIHLTGLSQVSGPPGPGRSRALYARRVTACPGRRGRGLLRPGIGDQVAVAHRIVADGELKHAVEDQPPAPGSPPVEAEAELVEVGLQVRVIEPALMCAQQPPL